jgi:arylformamidase
MTHHWIDISFSISEDIVTWPGDPKVKLSKASEIGREGADANVSSIFMSAHTGTHIDAPLHFIKDGKDIASLDLATLTGQVQIVEITDHTQVTKSELLQHNLKGIDKIIFKTVNSRSDWSKKAFNDRFVHLGIDAAQYLVTLGIKTVGVDYLSVGGMDNGTEVHHVLLGAGITILEGLNLTDILPGVYEMIALPIKIKGADGAPARVIVRQIE